MSDSYVYEESLIKEKNTIPFVKREILYVNDSNNLNYNGIIKFESSSTASSGKWSSYSEGIITAPIVIAMQSTTDISSAAGPNSFMIGLKNSYYQFVHQIQVILERTTIVSNCPFTNFYICYKLTTSFSRSDVDKYGSSLNFYLDSATSFNYTANGAATTNGNGLTNNVIYPLTAVDYSTVATKYDTFNNGFLKRLQNCGYNPSSGMGGCNVFYTLPATTFKNYYSTNTSATNGSTTGKIYYWNVLARWRLKDLNSFFAEVPLLRGGFFKINITTNTSSFTVSVNGATPPTMSISSSSNYTVTGGTNPLLVASAAANNPLNVVCGTASTRTFTIACGITSATINGTKVSSDLMSTCRLYVPVYTLNDAQEAEYVAEPYKTFEYTDIIQYQITGVTAGGTINALITNNQAWAQELVIMPFLTNAVNDGSGTTYITNQYESPFDTAPSTCCPLAALTNLNIQISGLSIWNEAQNYEFDTFLNEVAPAHAINGAQSVGLNSGLIDELAWSSGYRYYVVNLSRRLTNGDELIGKSYQITGKNSSTKTLDLMVFLSYKRSITLEKLTGFIVVD